MREKVNDETSQKTYRKNLQLHRQNNRLPIFFQLQKLNGDCNEELVQSLKSCLMQESHKKKGNKFLGSRGNSFNHENRL